MKNWNTIFDAIRQIARTSNGVRAGLIKTIQYARDNADLFNQPEYWNAVDRHIGDFPTNIVIQWAKEALGCLEQQPGWEYLLLDLGDCPEVFRLYSPGDQSIMFEDKLRDLMLSETYIGIDELFECLPENIDNPFGLLFGEERDVMVSHNVRTLDDPVLSWNKDQHSHDFHGDNGYLLWLLFASLAFIELLRDSNYCESVLRGRDKLYILVGFEEIFAYLVTLTPTGIQFETE